MTMAERLHSRWAFVLATCASLFLLFAAYSNYFHNAFHFDDAHVIESNLYIRSLSNIPKILKDAGTHTSLPANAQYRPLVASSLAFDYWRAGGLDPFQYHVTQFTLLLLVGTFLTLFIHTLFQSIGVWWGNRYLALAAATWFCVHTVNTETLNIISARSELFSAAGILGSFLLYLYWPKGRRFHIYLLPMMIGALAKVPAVMFAPLLFAYKLFFEQEISLRELFSGHQSRKLLRAIVETLPAFIVGVSLFFVIESLNHPDSVYAIIDRFDYLVTQPFVWLRYVQLFFVPLGLTADSDWDVLTYWYDTRFFAGMALIVGLLVLMVRMSRSRDSIPVAYGIAWFILGLLPSSSIFPLSEVTNEHRIFLPYMGLVMAVVWGGTSWLRRLASQHETQRRRIVTLSCTVLVIILCGHAWGTHQRNKVWLDGESLWWDVTQKSPQNGRGLMNYGLTQLGKGRTEVARDYFETAKRYTPNYHTLEVNLGVVYDALGDAKRAEGHYKRALQLSPRYAAAHFFYARWLAKNQRGPEALKHLDRALAISPGNSDARLLSIGLYAALGDREQLNRRLHALIEIDPENPVARPYMMGFFGKMLRPATYETYFKVGEAMQKEGNHMGAAQAFQQALVYKPQAAEGLNALGWSLSRLGFFDESIQLLERSVQIQPGLSEAQKNLDQVRKELAAASDAVSDQ